MERAGHLGLDVDTAGFRGILAARVLAISPHAEIVSRHDARIPLRIGLANGSNDAGVLPGGGAAGREGGLCSAGIERGTEGWIVLHSLAIAEHVRQVEGEADFVVIVPHQACS